MGYMKQRMLEQFEQEQNLEDVTFVVEREGLGWEDESLLCERCQPSLGTFLTQHQEALEGWDPLPDAAYLALQGQWCHSCRGRIRADREHTEAYRHAMESD